MKLWKSWTLGFALISTMLMHITANKNPNKRNFLRMVNLKTEM